MAKHDRKLNHEDKILLKKRMKRLAAFVILIICVFVFTRYVLIIAYVPSGSMVPTLNVGDMLVGDRVDGSYERGDIVMFDGPGNKYYVKRLIGLPGDHIEIRDNQIYLNGDILVEPYLKEEMDTSDQVFDVPKECFFFLGDNRNDSNDARSWDDPYVPRNSIRARILFKVWPLNDFASFRV